MLKELADGRQCIAIIGLEKNVGKTTLLNRLLTETRSDSIVTAVTSIGYDGEETDQVTQTAKPRIYISRGTLVATAVGLLRQCDFTRELLAFTGMNTPMGEVILVRALSDGYVQIAGPSTTSQMNKIAGLLKKHGAQRIFIDGAASRKSTAALAASDGCFLATGAAFSTNIEKLAEETVHFAELLSLQGCPAPKPESFFSETDSVSENTFVVCDEKFNLLASGDALSETDADLIARQIAEKKAGILNLVFFGVVTQRFTQRLLDKTRLLAGVNCIADDGTRFAVTSSQLKELKRRGMALYAANPVNLLGISVNPWAPSGVTIDEDAFRQVLSDGLKAAGLSVPIL